ncbi:DUF255 domain-containing protein [Streptomyces sp. NPDC058316]|uniref:DUF255 domain-containing protein n=1 Tax=unclassified Streptomyces TaxID=2593676 RepID=UPI0036E354C9
MVNRPVHGRSPYLQQHATNPVDWWEWGGEARSEAARRNVPILLSVGPYGVVPGLSHAAGIHVTPRTAEARISTSSAGSCPPHPSHCPRNRRSPRAAPSTRRSPRPSAGRA